MSKTPHTPHSRSRTPSRVGTPLPQPSPSRLIPPVLNSAPSLSSLKVYSHAPTPLSVSPPNALPSLIGAGTESSISSSSASIANAPTDTQADGILVPEPETEVEIVTGNVVGHIDAIGALGDEEAKKNLRDHLRRTLSQKYEHTGHQRPSKRKAADAIELQSAVADIYPPRQYFVLTDAGKPVFVSRQSDEDSTTFTSLIGLMQALISVFLDSSDKLRCINAGRTRITFLLRTPLYYACVSEWGEPESVTRFHLEYLHLQLLSVVSAEQLRRMFERKNNFDLRRLLSGAEPLFYSLLDSLEWGLALSTSSLHCLKMDPGLRRRVGEILVPTSKIKDVLYVILVAQGRVITLVRPKKHSIHPSDLHILINTIHSSSVVNSSAAASWLPICLPKFNPSAFVNAYVTFLRRKDDSMLPVQLPTQPLGQPLDFASMPSESSEPTLDEPTIPVQASDATDGDQVSVANETSSRSEGNPTSGSGSGSSPTPMDIGLICVSGMAEFDAVRNWCTVVSERMERDGLAKAIHNSVTDGSSEYSVGDLSIPGLRHFLYKNRPQVQVTMPTYEDPYDDLTERRRLITLYQTVHDAIHAKSGQETTLKLQYIRTERESVMGWITRPYELYLTMSPLLPKSAVINAANAIARWVQKEEKRLFLRDAPVF